MISVRVRVEHVRDLLYAQRPQPRLRLRETRQPARVNDHRLGSTLDDPDVAYVSVFTARDATALENRQASHDLGGRLRQWRRFRIFSDTAPT